MNVTENQIEILPENFMKIFTFLQQVREKKDKDSWQAVLDILKHSDDILSLEAEQTLRELLHCLPKTTREYLEKELQDFSQAVACAIINSELVEIIRK
ncbi:MAG: hypothetical protein ACFFD4_01380 [Candidatus Odinarchaeota archaeon]